MRQREDAVFVVPKSFVMCSPCWRSAQHRCALNMQPQSVCLQKIMPGMVYGKVRKLLKEKSRNEDV